MKEVFILLQCRFLACREHKRGAVERGISGRDIRLQSAEEFSTFSVRVPVQRCSAVLL